MAEDEKKDSGSGQRWWEFYAVRYGMGTVIGAAIFFYLCTTNKVFEPLLFLAQNKLEAVHLTLLAAYGLTFCYIASAPILVFHAGRFILRFKAHGMVATASRLLAFFVPLELISGHFFIYTVGTRVDKVLCSGSAFLVSALILMQAIFLYCCLHDGGKDMYEFYKKLANKRENAHGDITNSYRHLREHGNSFFIVLLELCLAMVLYTASKYEFKASNIAASDESRFFLIILVWIFPAVIVWAVGTLFERNFVFDETE